jgi:hypothetical protein
LVAAEGRARFFVVFLFSVAARLAASGSGIIACDGGSKESEAITRKGRMNPPAVMEISS